MDCVLTDWSYVKNRLFILQPKKAKKGRKRQESTIASTSSNHNFSPQTTMCRSRFSHLTNFFPLFFCSQKSPKKARKRKDSTKKAAASTSNHSSPTKQKAAKKGRKRKASNLHNTVESKAKKVKRSSLSESSPSSPALSAAAVAGWAASRSPAGWAGGSPAAGSSSPAGMSPRPPALKRKQSVEESLTCPTCDKLFIAKSILERHLKKSQHGMFEKVSSERMNREQSAIFLQIFANISHMHYSIWNQSVTTSKFHKVNSYRGCSQFLRVPQKRFNVKSNP